MATNTLPESNNHHHPSTPTIPLNLALNSSIDSYFPCQINGRQHTPTPLPTTSIAATDNLEPSHQLQHRERHRRTGGESERVERKKEGERGPELWKGRSPSSENVKEHRRRWSEDETEEYHIH